MRRISGFTLIELLVVVGIMGVLLSVGIAAYSKMNDKSRVQEASRLLQTTIRSWQKKADSGAGSSVCLGGKFTGMYVERVSATRIQATIRCSVPVTDPPSEEFEVPNFALVEEFDPFVLLPLGKGVEFPEDATAVARGLRIRNKQDTVRYIITVTRAGGVDAAQVE